MVIPIKSRRVIAYKYRNNRARGILRLDTARAKKG
jgi:hypothetical protein